MELLSKDAVDQGTETKTCQISAPASPKQLHSSSSESVAEGDTVEEVKNDEKTESQMTPKTSRSPRGAFVPNYEPIQTRKRAKISHDTVSSPNPASPQRKDGVQKAPRLRLSKEEVLTPNVGPKPRAVPKSLLILEPELLPRNIKKKRGRPPSVIQIHTSARVNKDFTISSPSDSHLGLSASKPCISSFRQFSQAILPTATENENASEGKQKETMEQGVEKTVSFILTTEPNVGDGSSLTAPSQTEAAADMKVEQGATFTIISDGIKGETPTSLLLLAEAANPTTANPTTACSAVSVSATQIPAESFHSSSGCDKQETACSIQGRSFPSLMVISSPDKRDSLAAGRLDPGSEMPKTERIDSSQWTCTVCGELINVEDRAQHVTQHLDEEDEEEFVCEVCGEQLKDEEDLELHMAVEHDEEEGMNEEMDSEENEGLPAWISDKNIEDIEATQDHGSSSSLSTPLTVLATTGSPIHTCDQCGNSFPFAAYLRQHVKEMHRVAGTVFYCNLCSRAFTSKTGLENHSRLHQTPGGRINFKCIRCSQCFTSASLLSHHAQFCLNKLVVVTTASKRGRGRGRGSSRGRLTDHICSACHKSFTSDVYLKAHQLSHETTVKTNDLFKKSQMNSGLQCLYCTEKFRHIGPLKEHILAQHPNAFPFKCSTCQRGFSRDSSRIAHEQTHQTEKLFFCSECGEGFTLLTYLNRHMKYRHLKLTKFPCHDCHKEFVRQADLIKHTRVHTGEKPYICELCGHGFGQQSNYKYHMMRHRGEKPHTCPMCNKGFRVPSHLKMHMQQHLNERFVCEMCDKVFSQNRYLQRHMRTHNIQVKAIRSTEHLIPATSSSAVQNVSGEVVETVIATDSVRTQSVRTEQIIVDSVGAITEHVVLTDSACESEPVIEFIINSKDSAGQELTEGSATSVASSYSFSAVHANSAKTDSGDGQHIEAREEQAYVNADEGTTVVVGAFSEGEGGSVEEGNVTLPFKQLTQLIGGKHYNCDVCSESFSIRPNSTYNMIHTGQSHILVISLNDHNHQEGTVP